MNPDIVFPLLFIGLLAGFFGLMWVLPRGPKPTGLAATGWDYKRRRGRTTIHGETDGMPWTAIVSKTGGSGPTKPARNWTQLELVAPPLPGHVSVWVPHEAVDAVILASEYRVGHWGLRWFFGARASLVRNLKIGQVIGAFKTVSTHPEDVESWTEQVDVALRELPENTLVVRWPDTVMVVRQRPSPDVEDLHQLARALLPFLECA